MRILIIEDDQQLCEALKLHLEHAGFQTDCVFSGADALYYALQPVYDIILLDRMLPGMDGISILKLIRENQIHTPVVLATAVDSVFERISGLDCGADDYVVKPYDVGELLARIRALIRRPNVIESSDLLQYEDLSFHLQNHELTCGESKTVLSPRESLLMEYFLQNPSQTLSRQIIHTRIWGPDSEVEDGNLDTYIYYLRKQLRNLKSRTRIATIHGVGYRLECD